jgi:tetratricopeptide (TPR) repeat protein
MRKLTIVLLLSVYCSLLAVFTGDDCAAQSEKQDGQEETVAARVIEAVTAQMKARVENLENENNAFKDKISAIEAQSAAVNREKDAVFGKIKMITQENTKLKEEVEALQKTALELGSVNKKLAGEKNNLQEKNTQLEKKLKLALEQNKQERNPKPQAKKEYGNKAKGFEPQTVTGRLEEENKGYREDNKKLRGDLKEALSQFANLKKSSERLKKETADMHYNLGVILQGQNKYDDAIREYEKVLDSRPDDVNANFNLAMIYDTVKNRRDEAIEHYRKYLKIGPEASDALEVEERLKELEAENKVWGSPNAKGVKESKGRW